MAVYEIEVRSAGRPFAEEVAQEGAALVRPTALGLVVGEHVDKIGFFEKTVEVVEKTVLADCVRFRLRCDEKGGKPVAEIVRGFKIGCFKIAREYGLADGTPIFADGFDVRRCG